MIGNRKLAVVVLINSCIRKRTKPMEVFVTVPKEAGEIATSFSGIGYPL